MKVKVKKLCGKRFVGAIIETNTQITIEDVYTIFDKIGAFWWQLTHPVNGKVYIVVKMENERNEEIHEAEVIEYLKNFYHEAKKIEKQKHSSS